MGFFKDAGEALFGTESKKAGKKAQNKAIKQQTAAIKDAKEQMTTASAEAKAANAQALKNAQSSQKMESDRAA